MKNILTFWSAFFLAVSAGVCQEGSPVQDVKPGIVALKGFYGFIIPHRKTLRDVADSNPWGVELEWSRQHLTQMAWNYCACYPRIGYAFTYTNFDNPEVLGNSYAASAFIEPFINLKGRIKPSFKLGIGLTYLDRIYDAETNPENKFFSFPISFFVNASVGVHYTLSDTWNMALEATYPHISNGGIQQPNKGINYPVAKLGVEYKIQPVQFIPRTRAKTVDEMHPERWYYTGHMYFSRKDVTEGAGKYTVLGANGAVHYVVTRLSAVQLGLDVVYDWSIKEKKKSGSGTEQYRPFSYSVLAGHDLLMGKFIFSLQLGYYLEKPSGNVHDLYERVGLEYRINDWLLAGFSLKTHTSVADFMDVRIGVRW